MKAGTLLAKEMTFIFGQLLITIGIGLCSISACLIYLGLVLSVGSLNGMRND